ncbi:MAG: hypothetical protein JW801_12455 [Bacteroidales bacterium]|nr:hypothetical protein [Bacteroidales bacterium]
MITNKVQAAYNLNEQDNPFPGLRAFGIEESHLFFGREGQSEIVLEYLAKNHFAAVTGASGSGKSSLIYCGLVPILFGGFITGAGSNWRIIATRPGNKPVMNLAEALAEAEVVENDEEYGDKDSVQNLIYASLRRNSYGLVDAISQLGSKKGENILLIIDQFEELFRFKESRDDKHTTINETEAFIKLLVNAVHQRKLPIYIVLTMRSDFIGECSQFQDLTALINDSNFLVPQMTREDFSKAVLGPIAVAGAKMDPQLYQEVLNSISEGSDQLPVLQHAMMRTWEFWRKYNEPGTPLRLRDYEAAGKMENALSMHANEAYEELSEEGKSICKSMFRTLTEKSTDNKGIRHPATIKEIADVAQAGYDAVREVVNVFRCRGRSFVTPAENIELTELTVIDISHESLMRVWDRLKGWVEEESNSVQMYMRLSEASSLYQLGKTGLWRPPDLQLALNWKKTQQPSLAWAKKYNPAFEKVMVFLDASEKKFQQEEQNKIKLQRRTLNRTRRFASFMGIAAILLIIAVGIAIESAAEAGKLRKAAETKAETKTFEASRALEGQELAELEAERARYEQASSEYLAEMAKMQADSADRAKRLAEFEAMKFQQQALTEQQKAEQERIQKELAEIEKNAAKIREIAATQKTTEEMTKRMLSTAQTMALRAVQTDNATLKGLLSLQAYKFNIKYGGEENSQNIYKGLHSAIEGDRGAKFNMLMGHQSSVDALAFLGSGGVFFSSGSDGNILRWDLSQIKPKAQVILKNNFTNYSLAASSNGRWLACGTGTALIQLFNLNQPNDPPKLLEGHQISVVDMDFIEGRDILLTVGGDKTVMMWNLLTDQGSKVATYSTRIRTIKASKDGNYVYGGTDDGKIIRWTLSSGEAKVVYDNAGESVMTLALDKRGRRMAFGDKKGNIFIIDPANGKVQQRKKPYNGRVSSLAFSPDDTQLASASSGEIHIWDSRNLAKSPIVITEQESFVKALAFSPDGKILITSTQTGEIYYWSSRDKYMASEICGMIDRNFLKQEWDIYIGNDISYERTCSNFE